MIRTSTRIKIAVILFNCYILYRHCTPIIYILKSKPLIRSVLKNCHVVFVPKMAVVEYGSYNRSILIHRYKTREEYTIDQRVVDEIRNSHLLRHNKRSNFKKNFGMFQIKGFNLRIYMIGG